MKTTPVKAQANHKHQKKTSKPLKKHEQTIKKTLEKGRANHKHKHQNKHGPRARENWKKTH